MLNKFSEINHKSFKNFTWGQLPVLARLNLFYGWNGTGKTTLSNLLTSLSRNESVGEGKVSFTIENTDIHGNKLGQNNQFPAKIKVFNEQFIKRSVLDRIDNLEHIVFLGEKSIALEKSRQESLDEQSKLRLEYVELKTKKTKTEKEFDDFKQAQALHIKTLLRTTGQDNYTNYSKAHFESSCESFNHATNVPLSDEKKDLLLSSLKAEIRPLIEVQNSKELVQQALPESIKKLLATSPTSSAIESLKSDNQLAMWLDAGLTLHQHRDAKACLFCEKPLESDRIKRLELHFDNSLRSLNEDLAKALQSIEALKRSVTDVRPYPNTSVYQTLKNRLDELNTTLEASKTGFSNDLLSLENVINKKQKNLFDVTIYAQELDVLLANDKALTEAREAIQALLKEHNQITEEFQVRIDDAKNKLEVDSIASSFLTFQDKKKANSDASTNLEKCTKRGGELTEIVRQLEEKLMGTAKAAESLNQDLALYLGHNELTLTHHEKGYRVSRGDAAAKDLSEGEKTAFALLYFLKTLEDHRDKLEDTIVVIDDPVSSLDESALFTAFGFIKERTEKAKQIIILTHNFALLRLVKRWFISQSHKNDKTKNKVHQFYSLTSKIGDRGKENVITEMDRLIRDYPTEYIYLFKLVTNGAKTQNDDLSALYGLPNAGRKLLEHFLAFKFPGGQDKSMLFDQMKSSRMDSKTIATLNRFLNIHSHGDEIAAPEHDLNLLSEAPKIMQAILEFMRKEDSSHVDRLEEIVNGKV